MKIPRTLPTREPRRPLLDLGFHPMVVGLLALALGLTLVFPGAAQATTYIVDPGGGGDSPTIGGAVSSASNGDTIQIASGTYTEFVSFTEDLVFIAEVFGQVNWQPHNGRTLFVDSGATLEIYGIRFTGNGSAIEIYTQEPCKIWNCTFENLTATGGGLGIYVDSCSIDVNECTFSHLEATGTLYGGAAIYTYNPSGTTSRIANSTFEYCTTFADGGAIDARCTGLTIENCEFRHCDALYGGAIYFICHESQIRNCIFENNHCDYLGGAIYVASISGDEIADNTFRLNTADSRGGALYAAGDVADATITRNLFVENTAAEGGAIYQDDFADVIEYCTFYGNEGSAFGSAIYVYFGSPNIVQNIFCRHDGTAAIYCSGTPAVACNAFWDNFAGDVEVCSPPSPANGNIFQDPKFCDAPLGDLTITFDSPCASSQVPGGCVGQMGRYGAACDETSVEVPSWGRLRSMFRDPH
ncbi:MAG: right-handed parallel beta-helix repeat-containing protein [Candidatus Eisenbacteria sp.]|nr:right-handed parallel beta-helix repeat-containing protein [Candidatus Eisenbacteria bacterium]